jgi:hypothetical protein
MGVRLREYLSAGRRGGVKSVSPKTTVEGWKDFERKLNKLGDFPKDMYKELRAENHRIGRVAARVIKKNLPATGQKFELYKRRNKGRDSGPGVILRTIPAGTLRRSIRTWNSKGSRINVQVGPRGRRGSVRYDGFFAGIVEGGHTGGMNRSTGSKFFNKIRPTLGRIEPRMRRIQFTGYRRIYNKWVKKL